MVNVTEDKFHKGVANKVLWRITLLRKKDYVFSVHVINYKHILSICLFNIRKPLVKHVVLFSQTSYNIMYIKVVCTNADLVIGFATANVAIWAKLKFYNLNNVILWRI